LSESINTHYIIRNPGYIAVVIAVAAVFASASSVLAAPPVRGIGQGERAEMRGGGEKGDKSFFVGTVLSASDTSLTVTPRAFGSSTNSVPFIVDTTQAEIVRVTKTPGSINSTTTTITSSEIQDGELVSITGARNETNRTVAATEVRVGEFVAMFGRGGEVHNGWDDGASSTRPFKGDNLNQTKDRATTSIGMNMQKENRGFWQKFRGFFSFK